MVSFRDIDRDTFDPRPYFAAGAEVAIGYRDRIGFLRKEFEFTIDLDDYVRP